MSETTALLRQENKEDRLDDIAWITQREGLMRSAREGWRQEWDLCDEQYEAYSTFDVDGKIIYNSPVEKDLVEFATGHYANKMNYNVVPTQDQDVQQTESAKHILDFYLDRGNFYEEKRKWDQDRAKYGFAILFCGMTMERDVMYNVDPDQKLKPQVGNGYYNNKYVEVHRESWDFSPKNVPIRNFFIDEKAMNQPDFEKAEDCIMMGNVAKDTVLRRWRGVPGFKNKQLDGLEPIASDDPEYGKDTIKGRIMLWYYFNRITKDYIIVANRTEVLYKGKYIYRDGRLPFATAQFYPNNAHMYSEGICKRIRSAKGYKNNMMQYSLDGARLNSSKLITLGRGNSPTDGEMYVAPGEMNMAEFSGGLENVGYIDTKVDINSTLNMLNVISDEMRQDSGFDIRATFEAPATTLGQTEIIEENKQIRQRSFDQTRAIAIDKALTMCLRNIADFAPSVEAKKIETVDADGNKVKDIYKYPLIRIKDVKIKKKGTKVIFEEDMGKYGFYEFKPKSISGELIVKVITPATQNKTLKAIEKNKFNEMVQNMNMIAQFYGPEEMAKVFPPQEMATEMKKVYGYDTGGDYYAMNKKDEINEENARKMRELQKDIALTSPTANNEEQAMQSAARPSGAPSGIGNAEETGPIPTASAEGTDEPIPAL